PDRHAADIQRERGAEFEPARAELDDVARRGIDHRRLDLLGGIWAGIDPGPTGVLDTAGRTAGGDRLLRTTGDEHRGTTERRGGESPDTHDNFPRSGAPGPLPRGLSPLISPRQGWPLDVDSMSVLGRTPC